MMEAGITPEEMTRAKGNVAGSLALSLEDSTTRMNRLGRNELTGTEHLSVDEIMEKIEAVTPEDIVAVSDAVYSGPYVIGAVGPFEAADLEEHVQ